MPEATQVPPGTYAGGKRSPIVWVYLCPSCGGYPPIFREDHTGALSGRCQGCGSECGEVHRFRSLIASAEGCGCRNGHRQIFGDLGAAQAASSYVHFAVCWGADDPNECAGRVERDDEADAFDFARLIGGGYVARRTVTCSPWERIEGETSDA